MRSFAVVLSVLWAPFALAQAPASSERSSAPTAPPAAFAPPPLVLPPPSLGAPAVPMSQRLIATRASLWNNLKFDRGGVTLVDSRYATGLDVAVIGSDRAVALAHKAHSDLVTAGVLTWSGFGLILLSAVGESATALVQSPANQSSLSSTQTAIVASAAGGLLVGIILTLVGLPYQIQGTSDAVNAYNMHLVDGRLRPPSAFALPPR